MNDTPISSLAAAAVGLLALVMVGAGCTTPEERLALTQVTHTPLPFDPTDPYELSVWWTNGRELLRLDENGGYALLGDMNRYHPPIERGSWSKRSYHELRLKPYEKLRSEWNRVVVSKTVHGIHLDLPGLDPMFGIADPPRVAEDDLFGGWVAASGALRLGADMRYTFTSAHAERAEADPPAIVTGHQGWWRLEDDRIRLDPDPPNLRAMRFTKQGEGDGTVLHSPVGVFHREPEETETRGVS